MWYFREMGRAEVNQDPTADYFFNVEALENLSDALVRESIQNSLDAKQSGTTGPVLVRITIPNAHKTAENDKVQAFLHGLWPHLSAIPDLDQLPSTNDQVPWILVEDFGTRGLGGDYAESDDPPDGVRNDFYYFWRNVGRGKKSGDDRGRWGLGKTMFPASSRINSFFGFTVRADDGLRLLMGQSVLRIHKIGGKKHYPFGYFGQCDSDDEFVTPITTEDEIANFKTTFSISRKHEAGLSVVIPFPHDGFGVREITHSVIHHYFFPIINGELEVEIGDGKTFRRITADTIDEIISSIEGSSNTIAPFLDLARTYLSIEETDKFETSIVGPGRAPTWNEDRLSPTQLDVALELVDDYKPVCFRIPVHIFPRGRTAEKSHFDVLIQRAPGLEKAEDIFIRQGITISGEHSLREPGVRALVIASDSSVATFLGDAENPAHTEWQEKSKKFKGKYNAGSSTLRFIKTAPQGLLNVLNRRSERIDDTLLRHLFPSEKSDGRVSQEPAERTGNPTRSARPKTRIQRRPPSYSLNKIDGGFSITLTDDGKTSVPFLLRIRCAYDVGRGNPFRKWAAEDFVLFNDPITCSLVGGTIISEKENTCAISVDCNNFKITIIGFDPHRDVITEVRVEDLENA